MSWPDLIVAADLGRGPSESPIRAPARANPGIPSRLENIYPHIDDRSDSRVWPLRTAIMWQPVILSLFIQRTILECYSSGEPAKDLISLLMLCATLNDSATEDVSRSPSPQVAVIIAR